ncbi:hypothetical protein ENUP19_0083G0048 [Entamoeba nuttalli]|uniref:C2 domain-containing protein n=2 Tax=Entamoeba nuttalli TaxID=412467 RepID=K2GAG4_ENTNP|nr:hypothetical protein ENU1_125250 [Entamoeba nuttalli P19]EKE39506.1 hypothetical protein ENU1_125250 [Entamoeba nuttalli P19]|eukprot:XP_008858159.1 hypothetical protein ENU1_125250 [Entamoeba nuttalli P19]
MEIELTLLGAKNIVANNFGGTSDGYVKFETRSTKQLKTKIGASTVNPIWNEKFDIIAEPKEEIVFHIFGHVFVTKDDCLGDAVLVVPAMVSGEYWHDCIPISKKGFLYVSLHCKKGVTSSLQHPFDPSADMVIRIDFIRAIHLGRSSTSPQTAKLIIKTPSQKEQVSNLFTFNLTTNIGETFILRCKPGEKMEIKIKQPGIISSHSSVDKTSYIIPDMREGEKSEEHLPGKKGCTLDCTIQCIRSVYHNVIPRYIPKDNDIDKDKDMKFYIYFVRAKNIIANDLGGTSDGYVKFKTTKSKEKKTYVFSPSINPNWNQCFRITESIGEEIIFHLFDRDTFTSDDSLGDAKWKVEQLLNNQWKKLELEINKRGTLYLEVKRVRTISETYKHYMNSQQLHSQQPSIQIEHPVPQYPQRYQQLTEDFS